MKEKIMKIILNKNLCLKILAGIIVIIAILVVTSCVKKTEYGNSNGNNNNLGLAVEKGKWDFTCRRLGRTRLPLWRSWPHPSRLTASRLPRSGRL